MRLDSDRLLELWEKYVKARRELLKELAKLELLFGDQQKGLELLKEAERSCPKCKKEKLKALLEYIDEYMDILDEYGITG